MVVRVHFHDVATFYVTVEPSYSKGGIKGQLTDTGRVLYTQSGTYNKTMGTVHTEWHLQQDYGYCTHRVALITRLWVLYTQSGTYNKTMGTVHTEWHL